MIRPETALYTIRAGLGGHAGLPPKHLTLHELGELIRRGGVDAGFVVQSEFKVRVPGHNVFKLDWVWLAEGRAIVAFEVEGRDVYKKSLARDQEKFNRAGAALNVVALFQLDHDHMPKRRPPWGEDPVARVKRLTSDAIVRLDDDLMSRAGIEGIQKMAQAHCSTTVRRRR